MLRIYFLYFKFVHPLLTSVHQCLIALKLWRSCLTAHLGICLVLLSSEPDTIHKAKLRKISPSTF